MTLSGRILGSVLLLTPGLGQAAGPRGPAHQAALAGTAAGSVQGLEGVTPVGAFAWQSFVEGRAGALETLAQPLLACVPRARSTTLAECADPTVRLQAAHALAVLGDLTGEQRYDQGARALVAGKLAPDPATLDLQGKAWLLALAAEARDSGLRKAADRAAEELEAELVAQEDGAFARGIMFGGAGNLAWPLLQLWSWADHTGDDARRGRLETFTRTRVLSQVTDSWCPLPVDSSPAPFEFLPPCLQRAMTVLGVMPQAVADPWLAEFMAAQTQLAPLRGPQETHAKLNFSRAWALWSIYQTTGDPSYRELYRAHVQGQLDQLNRQAARGRQVDPAVAAFGVYAISRSFR